MQGVARYESAPRSLARRITHLTMPGMAPSFQVLPGQPLPLGATVQPGGVNFSLYSERAERVELCLFDDASGAETARIPLKMRTGHIWYGFLPVSVPASSTAIACRALRARRGPALQPREAADRPVRPGAGRTHRLAGAATRLRLHGRRARCA